MIVLGDSSIGKTALSLKYTSGESPNLTQDLKPTLGIEYFKKNVTDKDGKQHKVNIWDTAG